MFKCDREGEFATLLPKFFWIFEIPSRGAYNKLRVLADDLFFDCVLTKGGITGNSFPSCVLRAVKVQLTWGL